MNSVVSLSPRFVTTNNTFGAVLLLLVFNKNDTVISLVGIVISFVELFQ
jgi:hypothetical protein